MNAEIIAVGSELLLGQIANTNGQKLSQELAELGIDVFFHTVVGDNDSRLYEAVEAADKRADIVLLTGGLGPTEDDLTRETVARYIKTDLATHEESMQQLTSWMAARGKKVSEANKKQALYLQGGQPFLNPAGLACGMTFQSEETLFILIPGPPRECFAVFNEKIRPYLIRELHGLEAIESRELRFFGIGESDLADGLQDLISSQTNPTIAPLASEGEVMIRLTAKAGTKTERHRLLDEMETIISERFGSYLYGKDKDTLVSKVLERYKKEGKMLAFAESLTGGGLMEEFTALPGSSQVVRGGVVSYATSVKESMLSANEVIDKEGVISRGCAQVMAEEVKQKFQADVGVSLTGVAGPADQEGQPPGTFIIGIATADQTVTEAFYLPGSRERVRLMAKKHASHLLLK
ncbi:competence/damage-inducible protein A [Salsuginibacillus kocurii]|uniref:competence/damage-inducible protein A n=1 Tax=Salsuginibacillus kocurii TaxID=427078 RepID=UPI0003665115|nr:competence/damage-inducible protein A [Salsuginibacillus kocurii]